MKKNEPAILICFFLLFIFFVAANFSCKQKNKNVGLTATDSTAIKNKIVYASISDAKKLLQDGELITRSDNDFESMIMQNFSRRERAYSHSGIVFKEGNDYFVYHCIGGTENPGGACRREPFDSFVNPLQKTGFGVFQYQLTSNETEKFHTILQKDYASKIQFDAAFNLTTDDSLYCSEIIYKSLKLATKNRIILPSSFIDNFRPKIMGYQHNNIFFKKFEFIGIDDLYLNSFCKEITRVKY